MAISWTLSVGGVTRPLATWGITDPQLSFRSLDVDELSFSVKGDVFGACPFIYGVAVVLRRNGTTWFSGIVTMVEAARRDEGEGWFVVVSGPWWLLQRTLFQQETAGYDNDCSFASAVKTTKVVLFQDPLTGWAISTGQQIANAITYALTQGIAIAAGAAPAFLTVPFEVSRDLTLGDVIRRCLQFTPDAVGWFDYSGSVPIFNCGQRSALTAAALDFTAERPAPRIEDFALRERLDLVPAGVRFNYIGIGGCPLRVPVGCVDATTGTTNGGETTIDGASASQGMKITQDSAGLPDQPGGIVGTIDLAQLTDDATEDAPIGLAGEYYARLLSSQWQGRVVVREAECSGVARPGQVLNLAGGNARWATMRAVVQEVRETLLKGETQITIGPAEYLGPQDFATLTQITRWRGLVQDSFAAVRAPGTPEAPNCHAGKDPRAKQLLDKLKGNGAAAVQAIGTAEIAAGLINGASSPWTPQSLELCDPPESTVSVLTPRT